MQNRPLRDFESGAHLHVLDWTHQTARQRFEAAGATQVRAAAKHIAAHPTERPPALPSLEAAVHDELRKLYALGHATVRSELDHQATGDALPVGLSVGSVPPAGLRALALAENHAPSTLHARAALIAQDVAHQIHQAITRARLLGVGSTTLRRHGREAGAAALRSGASHHAGAAISAGRHAAATIHTPDGQVAVIGARYTSVLDKNTCGPCSEADTGELLALDDPRLVHPPNPACLGGGRCRCLLVYQLATEGAATPTPQPVAALTG